MTITIGFYFGFIAGVAITTLILVAVTGIRGK